MKSIMQRIGFTLEEQTFFINLYESLSKEAQQNIDTLKYQCLNPGPDPVHIGMKTKETLTALALDAGVEPYSMHMLFVLLCAPELPRLYREKDLDEKYAYNLLQDIRCKLTECEKCKNIMGTQAIEWFYPHFLVNRFGLGRFQYDPYRWDLDINYHFGDIHITKGDPVYKIHIPSSGKMTRKMRLESYCLAHDFFGLKKGEPIVLFCRTWLLYEGYRSCYPAGSNLLDFMDDFDLIWNGEADRFNDAWRIFYRDYDGDTSVLPRETSLQRNFIEYIENGGKFGSGAGVIICDGEHILNNEWDN